MILRLAKLCILFLIVASSCAKEAPNGNNPPFIEYLGISKDTLDQMSGIAGIDRDVIVLSLKFEDIDGDIEGGNVGNISLIDTRDNFDDRVSFPELPELRNGQRGTIQIDILNTCCKYPIFVAAPCEADVPDYPFDKVAFEVVIRDAAGNPSNRITTDSITIRCN